ncbi:MAG: NAD(P)/FAD-dependent oxidoreductase, partial [Deltaproteobacteria bacterium]|nr:NAD(P)/FAD-dependent oxidoreductase [Deltaproteobacteria bacterium]
MTTAVLLSQLGKRVLVLEQHYVPGGFTHMFKRHGYEWDVGLHAVGEATDNYVAGRMLAQLTRGKLQWASLGDVYDEFYWPDGFRVDVPRGGQELRDRLVDLFPNEASAVDHYLELARDVVRGMKGHFLARTMPRAFTPALDQMLARPALRHRGRTTARVLTELTGDERLRAVLTAQWGYYGSVPARSSFAAHAAVHRHFIGGAFYPVGGAKQIARHMLQTLADNGGWTRTSCSVDQIVVEGGKAVGVRLSDGEEIRARRVVSAAGLGATVRNLLPEGERNRRWAKSLARLPPTPAHVCLYLGFKGDITEAGCRRASRWYYDSWNNDATWQIDEHGELGPAPLLYCSFPSLKDPDHDPGPDRRHTGQALTFVPWQAFERWQTTAWQERGSTYEDFKQRLEESLLEQLYAKLPGLRGMVDHVELSTPLSTDAFCRPLSGAIYGLEPTPERFASRWV